MNYSKPKVIAQNDCSGSFAAGCPTNGGPGCARGAGACANCEVTA